MNSTLTPSVVWFTGLSGSGKSTLANLLAQYLETQRVKVQLLDGDAIRSRTGRTDFSREGRISHIREVARVASRLESEGSWVLVALISPYRQAREEARKLCRRFFEVYVATPLEECERRDIKGLYRKARQGELMQFTGIDDPYEPPASPEYTVDTRRVTAEEACKDLIGALERWPGTSTS